MPLAQASIGESMLVVRVAADQKTRKHLQNLGIMSGASLTPLSLADGNMIVKIHDSRIALNSELAKNIIVSKLPFTA